MDRAEPDSLGATQKSPNNHAIDHRISEQPIPDKWGSVPSHLGQGPAHEKNPGHAFFLVRSCNPDWSLEHHQLKGTKMDLYNQNQKIFSASLEGDTLKVSFTDTPATAGELIEAATRTWTTEALRPLHGLALKIDGPISIPLAMTLAMRIKNVVGSVYVRVPRENCWVLLS